MFSMALSGQQRMPLPVNGLDPAASPDGQRVALGYAGELPYYSIHIAQAPFANLRKLTPDALPEAVPAWSPDGVSIAYTAQVAASSTRPVEWEVRVIDADGTQERTILHSRPGIGYSSLCWSPDGRRIAFTRYAEGAHARQIGVVQRDGSDELSISDGAANDRVLGWRP
jgi:Tol biopolymer transport system component